MDHYIEPTPFIDMKELCMYKNGSGVCGSHLSNSSFFQLTVKNLITLYKVKSSEQMMLYHLNKMSINVVP